MVSKCFVNSNAKYFHIAGNILLFTILVGLIYYYFKLKNVKNQQNKEDFVTSEGCFIGEQYEKEVSMRPCSVYFTNNEQDCDENFQYYDMTDVQIDRALRNAPANSNLYNKLIAIRNYLSGNNFKKCKIDYSTWTEMQRYTENEYIYPKKNALNADNQVNFKLWNTCFNTNISELDNISYNSSVIPTCTDYITNIHDVAWPTDRTDEKYVTINFDKSINYTDVYDSICAKNGGNNAVLNISNSMYFIALQGEYISGMRLMIKDIAFVNYDANTKSFVTIDITNDDVKRLFNNLFCVTYDKTLKRIVVAPRNLTMAAYLLNYDLCRNIKTFDTLNVSFNFRDFRGTFVIVDIDLRITEVPELIAKLDTDITDTNVDNQQNIENIISDIIVNIQTLTQTLQSDIDKLNGDIKTLNAKLFSDYLKNKNSSTSTYLTNINNSRTNTDAKLQQYMNKIKVLKDNIQNELVRVAKERTLNDAFIAYVIDANRSCSTSATEFNTMLDTEYTVTVTNITNLFTNVMNAFYALHEKGIYYSINLYKTSTAFNVYTPKSQNEFTCMLAGVPISRNFSKKKTSPAANFKETSITPSSDEDYYILEIFSNIRLTRGYYYFFIDLSADESTDVFLGYQDNSTASMVFKNVASYYYSNPNDASDIRTRKTAKVAASTKTDLRNMTTKFPIYIDGNYNAGYYAFYARSLRHTSAIKTSSCLNIKYIKLDNNALYYNITDVNYEYIAYNSISQYKSNDVSSTLYINKNLGNISQLSAYYKFFKTSTTVSYPNIYNESTFLTYRWDFNNTLNAAVGGTAAKFIINNATPINNATYSFSTDTKHAGKSLKITTTTNYTNAKLISGNVVLTNSFTWSFWAKTSKCCSTLASINDNLAIDMSLLENKYSCQTGAGMAECRNCIDIVDKYKKLRWAFDIKNLGVCNVKHASSYSCSDKVGTYTYSSDNANLDKLKKYDECKAYTYRTVTMNNKTVTLNEWVFYTITYNQSTKTLKFYYNGVLSKTDTNYIYDYTGSKIIKLFKPNNKDITVYYSDLRIHSKVLSQFEILCLYYNISNNSIKIDTGLKESNPTFYITCPTMPKASDIPAKAPYIVHTNMDYRHPIIANSSGYIPVQTQEQINLQNFFNLQTVIASLQQMRLINLNDCTLQTSDISTSSQAIAAKQLEITNKRRQININDDKIAILTHIYNQVNSFVKDYDFNTIKQNINNVVIFENNSELFNKYLPTVFKNLQDGKHYIYLQL